MADQDKKVLQSQDTRNVLDIIDSLRSQGISRYVDLPQIIVCGDQSSGKSSVLEAISGMSFPTKDALCTRFATELVLRRTAEQASTGVKVSILPGKDRSESERTKLEAFGVTQQDYNLRDIVDQATEVMGLNESDKVFCNDILRVEVSSPEQPHLTLVDLPGLFMAGNKDQSVEDAKLVEKLVLSYMEQERSIILAVVSAKSEFALQQVTQRARELDPQGHRTLGLITKPDTLDEGSENEQAYIELAQNRDVKFRLGWHVVKNRDFKMRDATNEERDASENAFFSQGVWLSLSRSQVGVDALRTRLSNVLQNQIMTHLPQVLTDIRSALALCESSLDKLGAARSTTAEQRKYLFSLSQHFTSLVKACVEGDYSDRPFFGDSSSLAGRERRLRAQVQKALRDFAEVMRHNGQAKIILETQLEYHESPLSAEKKTYRARYVEHVSDMLQQNQGRELTGTFNPLIVGELFSAQCEPWEGHTKDFLDRAFSSVRKCLLAAMGYAADEETSGRLTCEVLNPSLDELEQTVLQKLRELLEPHNNSHPITYNHYLTDNVQKIQQKRHCDKLASVMEQYMDIETNKDQKCLNAANLFKAVKNATEPNMENYASMTATDMMEAYYKVAIKKYVDDIGVLAMEQCLIKRLPSIFSPDSVCDLSDDDVMRLAGESPGMSAQRTELTEKKRVLTDGLAQLSKMNKSILN